MTEKTSAIPRTQTWTRSLAKGLLPVALIWPQSGMALTAATAGSYAEEILRQVKDIPRFIIAAQPRLGVPPLRTVGRDLELIRTVFSLKISEIAQIFDVSRPTVYAWLDGSTPRPEVLTRLAYLSKEAEKVNQANITRVEHFVRRPLADGRSLLQLLKEGANTEQALSAIKHAAAEEESSRKLAVSRHSPSKKGDTASIDELSVPIVPET
jgi:hypothetical protein